MLWRLKIIGGPGRVRTDDLFHAMEARSQLRHRPTEEERMVRRRSGPDETILAYPERLVKPGAKANPSSCCASCQFYENYEVGYAEDKCRPHEILLCLRWAVLGV